jgi:rare lipoprotein A
MNNAVRSVVAFLAAMCLLWSTLALVGCSSKSKKDPFAGIGSPIYKGTGPLPKGGGRYTVGDAYEVAGLWFRPKSDPTYDRTGVASWYGPQFHRRMTSNGEWFDMDYMSAAHTTMPLPSYAKVTNLENGRSIVVRVNDRGPFVDDRIIDLSRRSADILGFIRQGTAQVRVQYIGPAPLNDTGSHLAAMNDELLRGTPLRQMLAAAEYSRPQPQLASMTGTLLPPAGQPEEEGTGAQPMDAGDNLLFIQVGAFSNVDNAERARMNLARLGEVRVTPVSATSGLLYRVTLLPQSDRVAGQTLNEVQAAGHRDARLVFTQ